MNLMNPTSPMNSSNSNNPMNSSNPLNPTNPSNQVILLTIDVEDWFQVENLRACCPVSSWSSYDLRVEKNTHRLLDLLDSIKTKNTEDSRQNTEVKKEDTEERRQNTACNISRTSVLNPQSPGCEPFALDNKSSESCLPAVCLAGKSCLTSPSPLITNNGQLITDNGQQRTDNGEQIKDNGQLTTDHGQHEKVRGTFFVLGWIAERLPNLVREIHARGHEIASHGFHHDLCSGISKVELRRDLQDSKKLLEDMIGDRVYGYRAPSFSISDDILQMIAEAGYQYDSSYNSFGMHGRYGKISLNGSKRSGIAILLNQKSTIENQKFYELPISNLVLSFGLKNPSNSSTPSSLVLPWGGGAYFRLIPSWVFMKGIREILRQQQAYLFYMHPWELDPEQPRPEGTAAFSRFKHYTNLSRTEGKLKSLLQKFSECSFVSCHEHLERDGAE
jgi:polysaccharide deacetylase family protein (PEP-CTERM system associated)